MAGGSSHLPVGTPALAPIHRPSCPPAQFADLHSLLPSPCPLVPLPLCTLVSVSARPATCLLCRRANITVPALSSRSALVHSYLPLPASSLSCPPVAAPAHAFASAPTFVCPPSRTCPTACDRTCPPPPWCSPSHLRACLCLEPRPTAFVHALPAFAYLLAHLPCVAAFGCCFAFARPSGTLLASHRYPCPCHRPLAHRTPPCGCHCHGRPSPLLPQSKSSCRPPGRSRRSRKLGSHLFIS